MFHKWLEEWYDTLLYLGVLLGALIFFMDFWKDEYQIRYAEVVIQEFISETSAQGKISWEDYEQMIINLERINSGYEMEIKCTKYLLQPVYALIPEEEIVAYYMKKNTKQEIPLMEYKIIVEEEEEEKLFLQTETNATILAAERENFISLPEDGTVWSVEALRPFQEVYEGEKLVSLCRINSQEGSYYAEAEPIEANASGTVWLRLQINDEIYQVPVEVVCHPRRISCKYGHEVINSKEVLAEYKKTGNVLCPYCKMIPEYIVCNKNMIYTETGQKLSGEEVWITAVYLDGHAEKVIPEAEEWQDTYDENYCGIQTATIHYRGKEAVVTVVSENRSCQQCNEPCNERCYQDYIMFPYCTSCMSKIELFTGKVIEEEQIIMTNELLACLDENKELLLQRGDYITLILYDSEKNISIIQEQIKCNGK